MLFNPETLEDWGAESGSPVMTTSFNDFNFFSLIVV